MLYYYNNTENRNCQDVLIDKSSTGRERPWANYKFINCLLSDAYLEIDQKKVKRLNDCSVFLKFLVDDAGKKTLIDTTSCRVRLCPICTWRRSLKSYANTLKIVNYLISHREKYGRLRFLFVTLTVKNCAGEDLIETIDGMFYSFKKLNHLKIIEDNFLGSVRNFEVTHNCDINSESYDTYHPHIHFMVAVRQSYFNSGNYITKFKLSELWKKCLKVNYDPIVDIRVIRPNGKGSIAGAVAECSKYSAKSSDYVIPEDWDLSVETVKILDKALSNRRLVNYSGIFREAKNELKIEDKDEDLIYITGKVEDVENTVEETYVWDIKRRNYFLLK